MRKAFAAWFLALAAPCAAQTPATNMPATNALPGQAAPDMSATVSSILSKASEEAAAGNLEQAARDACVAIQIDPHNASAFELRGSVYIQQKLWDRADRDYQTADKLAPQPAYKFKLGEIKYLQRSYEDARVRFVKVQDDPRLGDLATYKIFLCDLLAMHEGAAGQDLARIDGMPKSPAYYFCHAAWDLYHNQLKEANGLLAAAQQAYDSSIIELYYGILLDTRRFTPDVVSFSTKEGHVYAKCRIYLDRDGLRVGTDQGWITLPLDQLPDNLSAFPPSFRDEIVKRRSAVATEAQEASTVSFTTRTGKTYDHVRWAIQDQGLSVLDAGGWSTVPYAQLPEDVTAFPADLQKALLTRRDVPAVAADRTTFVTFTGKDGTHYDHARASLGARGLHILTTTGWKTLTAAQLPEDLSVFPAEWRATLENPPPAARVSVNRVISFTTRQGKTYTDVNAALEDKGLRLLTWQGWIAVPFDQLPDDLSAFPESWREQIVRKRTHAASR